MSVVVVRFTVWVGWNSCWRWRVLSMNTQATTYIVYALRTTTTQIAADEWRTTRNSRDVIRWRKQIKLRVPSSRAKSYTELAIAVIPTLISNIRLLALWSSLWLCWTCCGQDARQKFAMAHICPSGYAPVAYEDNSGANLKRRPTQALWTLILNLSTLDRNGSEEYVYHDIFVSLSHAGY